MSLVLNRPPAAPPPYTPADSGAHGGCSAAPAVDVQLGRSVALTGVKNTVTALVTIRTPPAVHTEARAPIHIACVLDKSGSMAGSKLSYARKATSKLIKHLNTSDALHVVTYDSKVHPLFENGDLSCDGKKGLEAQVKSVRAGSCTNLMAGLEAGVAALRRSRVAHVSQQGRFKDSERMKKAPPTCRVMLFSDGLVNVGVTNRGTILGKVRGFATEGIQISTFGIGSDFDESLMTAIAEVGNGFYSHLKTATDIPKQVGKALSSILSLAGVESVLQLQGLGGACVTKIHSDSDNDSADVPDLGQIQLGDLHYDNERSVLAEIELPAATSADAMITFLRCQLAYKAEGLYQTIEKNASIKFVSDRAEVPEIDGRVAAASAIMEAARAAEEVIDLVRLGEYSAAESRQQRTIHMLDSAIAGASSDPAMQRMMVNIRTNAMSNMARVQEHEDADDYCVSTRYEVCLARRMSVGCLEDREDSDEDRDWSEGWSDPEDEWNSTASAGAPHRLSLASRNALRYNSRGALSSDSDTSDSDSDPDT